MNRYTITIEEDPETGELMLPFSDELMNQLGWNIGDTIIWTDLKNGSWSLTKKEIKNEIHTDS